MPAENGVLTMNRTKRVRVRAKHELSIVYEYFSSVSAIGFVKT